MRLSTALETHLKELAKIDQGERKAGTTPPDALQERMSNRSHWVQENLKLLRDLPQKLAKSATEFGKSIEPYDVKTPDLQRVYQTKPTKPMEIGLVKPTGRQRAGLAHQRI